MADIQAAGTLIDWTVKGITILLMIIAASIAIKKKNNLVLAVAVLGNLVVYYFTLSPLLCMIVSVVCIVWANSTKGAEQEGQKSKIKIGNIIGLIIGIGFVAGPLIGYMNQEASLSDPTTQGILILFAVIGGFMIINNLFKLFEKEGSAAAPAVTTVKSSPKAKAETGKIRCRFCKKLYSSDYNGCPYCKKK